MFHFGIIEPWFCCEIKFKSANQLSGLRRLVYNHAGAKGAMYSTTDKISSIYYEGNSGNLIVRVLFSTESECGSFQSTLIDLVRPRFDVSIEPTEHFTRVHKTENHVAILSLHYDSSDDDHFPECFSIESRLTEFETVPIHADMQEMMWENVNLPCFAGGSLGHLCHLMSQTAFYQHSTNPNNTLIMSWENHARFDGFSVEPPVPKFAIRYVDSTNNTVVVGGTTRTLVRIAIECSSQEVYNAIKLEVKPGHEAVPDENTFYVLLAVPDPNSFRRFITFKYWENRVMMENSILSETKENQLKRARETARKNLANEQNFDMTEQSIPKKKQTGDADTE